MKKLIVGVLILLALAVVGLQVFLAYGLTDSLRKWVLPMVKERFQLDVAVERVSVNLLDSSVSMRGIQVANPPGYQEPQVLTVRRSGVRIGLPALFRGRTAEIRKMNVKGAELVVVRNAAGQVNLQQISEAIHQAVAEPPAPARPPPTAPVDERKIPDVLIRRLEIQSRIRYLDYQLAQPPFQLNLEFQLSMTEVANYGSEDNLSGTIALEGVVLPGGTNRVAFDLNGKMAPLADPTRLSFDLVGSMQELPVTAIKRLADQYELEGGTVAGTISLVCRRGVFDPDKSVLRLTFRQVKVSEKKRAEMGGLTLPESVQVLVPVSGVLTNPQIDMGEAITKMLLSKDVFEGILNEMLEKQGGRAAPSAPAAAKSKDPAGRKEMPKPEEQSKSDPLFDLNKTIRDMLKKKD